MTSGGKKLNKVNSHPNVASVNYPKHQREKQN